MAHYLVSYDLIKDKDYMKIQKAIQSIANGCCRPLKSVWIIGYAGTHVQLRDQLLPYIDRDDKLLVVELTGQAAWTTSLEDDQQDWLRKYLHP